MLLIIFISQKFCVIKLVHVNLSYIIPQIYMNMAEIWDNVGMFKKYYYICIWYIIYNQYSIITDIFRSLYLFYPFCPLNLYLTSKTRVGRVFAIKPGFLPSLFTSENNTGILIHLLQNWDIFSYFLYLHTKLNIWVTMGD